MVSHPSQSTTLATSTATPTVATPTVSIGLGPRVYPQRQGWQNHEDDRPMRQLLMLRLRRLHPVLTAAAQGGLFSTQGPSLVQRLEWMLYNSAHSRHEYAQEFTLERRVQALVTGIDRNRIPRSVQERDGSDDWERRHPGEAKRDWVDVDREAVVDCGGKHADVPRNKRRHVEATEDLGASFTFCTGEASEFILNNDDSLVNVVLSFLPGKEVLRLRSVNRFLCAVAPRAVLSLNFDTLSPALTHFKPGVLTALLLNCSNLISLAMTSKPRSQPTDTYVAGPSPPVCVRQTPHITQRLCSPNSRRFTLPSGDANASELLLRDMVSAFKRGACPELRVLDLGSPRNYFANSDDVLHCLEAFAEGRLQAPHIKPLKHLKLDSTYLGDARLARLAVAFESASPSTGESCFGALETLVLRHNFIGEAGCQALLRMLRHTPKLRVLDVSGNILTDLDVVALADWIDPCSSTQFLDASSRYGVTRSLGAGGIVQVRSFPGLMEPTTTASPAAELRVLLLQDNFIGREGQEALVRAVKAQAARRGS